VLNARIFDSRYLDLFFACSVAEPEEVSGALDPKANEVCGIAMKRAVHIKKRFACFFK
jgi:hypothetical protein